MLTNIDIEQVPAINDKDKQRAGYIELMKNINAKYHLTITFPKNTPKQQCKKLLNELLKNLNRKLYKKRYTEGKSYIKGVAVLEHTFAMETDHFHLLIADSEWLPTKSRLIELLERQLQYFSNSGRVKSKRNFIAGYKLQDYYNNGDNKLEGYLTKLFEGREFYERNVADDIGILGTGSVAFGF